MRGRLPTHCEIGAFQALPPLLLAPQEQTLDWLASAHATAAGLLGDPDAFDEVAARMGRRLRRFGCKADQIGTRGYDTFDVRTHDFAAAGLYALGANRATGASVGPNSSTLGERSAIFAARVRQVFADFYPEVPPGDLGPLVPDHLIHVTCTGYIAPSAPQQLVSERGWHEQTAITHAYHMGCYAAFPAIRMAEGLTRSAMAHGRLPYRADLVHTELCTLHLNPADSTPEQMVVHSLFADGHIKYSLQPPGSLRRGFRLLHLLEEIVPDSLGDMTWTPDHWGFRMGLSREVPRKIAGAIRGFVQRLAEQSGCDLGDLLREARFAIHPGGPKIIGSLQELLELRDDQTAQSKEVLFARGNMSSATLPHVWLALDQAGLPPGTKVVSLAFGPGLTIFGSVFEVFG